MAEQKIKLTVRIKRECSSPAADSNDPLNSESMTLLEEIVNKSTLPSPMMKKTARSRKSPSCQ
jgi:hypothetical protein